MRIVTATSQHIPAIIGITEAVWPPTYGHIIGNEQIRYMIDRFYAPPALEKQMAAGHRFIVVYDGDDVIAFASWSLVAPQQYKLHKLYILPSVQGKGVGRKMLDYIVADINDGTQTIRLLLNVNRHNTPAIGFYTRLGFARLHDEDIDIGSGYFMNDHVLYLDI